MTASLADLYDNADDLVFTLLVLVVTFFFCDVLRRLLITEGHLEKLGLGGYDIPVGATEMIGTMESAVICFECNIIVYELFGAPIYTTILFLTLMWQTTRGKFVANPSILVIKHIKGLRGPGKDDQFAKYPFLLIMFLGEIVGIFLAYYWIQLLWNVSYHWTFWKRSNHHMARASPSSWSTQLRSEAYFGILIEGGFSFLSYLWHTVIRQQNNANPDKALTMINAGKAIFSGIANQYTGGFFNPILATALEFTVGGHSMPVKFQVYWVAPIVCSLIAMFVTQT